MKYNSRVRSPQVEIQITIVWRKIHFKFLHPHSTTKTHSNGNNRKVCRYQDEKLMDLMQCIRLKNFAVCHNIVFLARSLKLILWGTSRLHCHNGDFKEQGRVLGLWKNNSIIPKPFSSIIMSRCEIFRRSEYLESLKKQPISTRARKPQRN